MNYIFFFFLTTRSPSTHTTNQTALSSSSCWAPGLVVWVLTWLQLMLSSSTTLTGTLKSTYRLWWVSSQAWLSLRRWEVRDCVEVYTWQLIDIYGLHDRTELTGLVSRSRCVFSVSSLKTLWRRGLWRGPRWSYAWTLLSSSKVLLTFKSYHLRCLTHCRGHIWFDFHNFHRFKAVN